MKTRTWSVLALCLAGTAAWAEEPRKSGGWEWDQPDSWRGADREWQRTQDKIRKYESVPEREAFQPRARREKAKPAAEQVPEWKAKLQEKLAAQTVKCDFKETPFEEACDALRTQSGVPIHLDRKLRTQYSRETVTFRGDVALETALRWVVRHELGLDYVLLDGVVFVTDRRTAYEKSSVPRVYDISDLLGSLNQPDFVPPRIGIVPDLSSEFWNGPPEEVYPRQAGEQDVIRLLERAIPELRPQTPRPKETPRKRPPVKRSGFRE